MRNQDEDRKGKRKRLLRNGSLYLWPPLRSGVAYCLYILMERYDRHADRQGRQAPRGSPAAGERPRLALPTRGQISLPKATAVSAMRFENPHSLSYQDITRQKVPSMTLVWSMWKIEECLSWLKSEETSLSSV